MWEHVVPDFIPWALVRGDGIITQIEVDAWVAEEFPDLVGRGRTRPGGPKSLMRAAWDAATERAAKAAEEYTRQHGDERSGERIQAREIAARIRGGA
jgi:hypothetical protein